MTSNGPITARHQRRVALIVVVAILVAVTAGTVALVATHGSGSGDAAAATPTPVPTSPVLRLERTQTSDEALLAGAASASAGSGKLDTYRLRGSLPTGSQQGVVIDSSSSTASRARVAALVRTLGFTTAPKQVPGGWTAHGMIRGEPASFGLDETGGNVWSFGFDAVDCGAQVVPGEAADPARAATANCAGSHASAVRHGQEAPKPSGRAALLRDAAGVFKAVGVTPGTDLATNDSATETTLGVPLDVESLPVVQVALYVSADDTGLTSASGWLDPTFTTVGEYPLVSAAQALATLNAEPRALPCVEPTKGAKTTTGGCGPRTQTVTAARLAWLPSHEGDRTLLVPAWQFEVDGFYDPAIVALATKYLAAPAGAPTPAGVTSAPAGTPSAAPGSTPGHSGP